jgi:minor extracellular serine protease Vpr
MGPTGSNDKSKAEVLRRSKISPHLLAMIADWERRERRETPSRAKAAKPGEIPVVPVLIELNSQDTSELVRAGIQFKHLFGLFYAADVPLDKVEPLADLESIVHVHMERSTKPTLDDSIPEIRCNSVRNSSFPFEGTNKYTGFGVLVGIIDSGINILHPVFRLPNDQTKSRILAILDQTQSPAVTFNKTQIEAAIATQTQIIQPGAGTPRVETHINDHKHGTHVAGIAAGNGFIAGNCSGQYKYVGVAPEATLVIVKHDFAGGTASLQAAIQFVADQAAAIPGGSTPAVINMSLGHSLGPHDGTDPLDQMIDTWLSSRPAAAAPVVLVASAGNSGGHYDTGKVNVGGDDSHATGTIPPGSVVKALHFNVSATDPQQPQTGQKTISAEIRFTAPNGVGCKLTPPGNTISGGSNTAAADASTNFTEATQTSTCTINGSIVNAAANTRRVNITVTSAAAGQNQPGDWTIEFTNAGAAPITYNAWITGDQFERFTDDLSRASTIGSPGSSRSIIAVGSYVKGKNKGQLADSSSRGPLLDAAATQKPDLCAPGETITSAARDFHDGCCCDCCCDSYIGMFGTSMAAPHVTGAVALMLERNMLLTQAQVKTVLMNHGRKDGFTGPGNNNDYGNGKLDVIAILNDPLVKNGLPDVTGAEMPSLRPRASLAEQAALAAPLLPQLEEGTPLWRLLRTEEGQQIYELGRAHWEEARMLVNTRKRIATVWHRNHGPLLLHHVIRATMIPDVPLPRELEGEEISVRAARIVTALEADASRELRAALHTTLPWVARLQGKTLLEVVEMLEASQVQHA